MQDPYEEVLDRVADALEILSGPLSEQLIGLGWTEEKRSEMVGFLQAWQRDILDSGRLVPSHERQFFRWFYDQDIDIVDVGESIVAIDGIIFRSTEDERNQLDSLADDDEPTEDWKPLRPQGS